MRAAGAAVCAAWQVPALALMAGAPPDSPQARVDPNTTSSRWSGVVSVVIGGAPFSGVVVAPHYVLTAAHVALGQQPANVQVLANIGPTPLVLAVEAVTTYPTAAFPYDDLSLLRLSQPVPAGVAVYAIADAAVALGTAITLVGYGGSGAGNGGVTVQQSSIVKRTGRNVIDQYTDRFDTSGRTSAFFVYDFDGATGKGPLGGATLGNTVETAVAGGDSGSASFIESPSGPLLFGLNTVALTFGSAPASSFGSGGGGIVLNHPPYLEWLQTQTGRTLTLGSAVQSADVPLLGPGAGALLAGVVAARFAWARR